MEMIMNFFNFIMMKIMAQALELNLKLLILSKIKFHNFSIKEIKNEIYNFVYFLFLNLNLFI